MDYEWQIGDWCEYNGIRCLVFDVSKDNVAIVAQGQSQFYKHEMLTSTRNPLKTHQDLKHLPDCTGWDWVAPKAKVMPPEGYRLLERHERVEVGDICTSRIGKRKGEWVPTGGKCIGCSAGWRIDSYGVEAYARKIEPKYRPFKNDIEFRPYADKWITRLDCNFNQTDGYWRIIGADKLGVWGECDRITYQDLFDKFHFHIGFDGEEPILVPCGVAQ